MTFLMNDPYWMTLVGFVIGSCVGSFLNVCAYRIPKSASIVSPRSFCPGCQTTIPWTQNLPLLTWLLQKGQASCCSFKIPVRYFLVELSTGLVFGFLFFQYASSSDWASALVGCVFAFLMIAVIVIDMETMTIPDRFSMGGAALGLVFSFAIPSIHLMDAYPLSSRLLSLFDSIMGFLVGSALLYWIGAIGYRVFGREALGEGDVKLLGCIGAFCGWKGAVFTIFGGALIGCLLLLPIILIGPIFNSKSEDVKNPARIWGREIPFGPFLALAALFFWNGFNSWVDAWYMDKVGPIIRMLSG